MKTTSQPEPSGMTRIGLEMTSPVASVTSWSSTPKSLRSANATSTRPDPVSTNQCPSTFSTAVPSPCAQFGMFAGSTTYS